MCLERTCFSFLSQLQTLSRGYEKLISVPQETERLHSIVNRAECEVNNNI